MKKSCLCFLVCIMMLGLGQSALAGEQIYWSTEIWNGNGIRERHVISYDFESGEIERTQIPTEWIPLTGTDPKDGLYFMTKEEGEENTRMVDIYRWKEGETSQVEEDVRVWIGNDILMYGNGWLYVAGEDSGRDDERVCILPEWVEDTWVETRLWTEAGIWEDIVQDGSETMQIMRDQEMIRLQNADGHAYVPKYVDAMGWSTKSQKLYAWRFLDDPEIQSISLYHDGEFGDYSEYRQQLYWVFHLVECDLENGTYSVCLSEDGNEITMTDMEIDRYRGNMYYLESRNSFIALCEDESPVENFEHGYELPGRMMVVEISLDTGEVSVLYANGCEKPDYAAIWPYVWKQYGKKYGEQETYTRLTEEEYRALDELQYTDTLNDWEIEQGVREEWPDRFCVAVSGDE